ncbi:MAG: YutD family protein [Lactobacillus sp.]|uniref:DUF1027 domain-containing protein n=1 Tax=Bombilactobacillus bombi TaxID=1303590 RepID=A0A417ZIS0_9LACO|nr:YutD family protein [Bombilactobacillus bombi]MCO6543605.1 YutD family protein [Lactobacillus sp.]RHW51763.1 DUF1027 domain-containing protein [Bombilactobacillus bombi]
MAANDSVKDSKKDSILSKSIAHAIAASSDETEAEVVADVVQVRDNKVKINQDVYTVAINQGDNLDTRRLAMRYNAVLRKYDYIVGDWGYGQLRLRGFYDNERPQAKIDQKIATLQDYLLEYCNFGCDYFVLEREQKEPLEPTKRTIIQKKSIKHNNHHKQTPKYRRRRVNDNKSALSNSKPPTKMNANKTHKKAPFKIRNLK